MITNRAYWTYKIFELHLWPAAIRGWVRLKNIYLRASLKSVFNFTYIFDFKAFACETLKAPDHGLITISKMGDVAVEITARCHDGYVPRTPFAPHYYCFCSFGFHWCIDSVTEEKVTTLPNCIRKCFILLKLHCIVVLNLSILILC